MLHLVVDALGGGWPRGGEIVDRDPGEDLVVGPGVRVAPVAELLVDPGEEADGGVGEGEGDGERFRGQNAVVPVPLRAEVLGAGEAGEVGGREVDGRGRRGGQRAVQMRGLYVGRVGLREEAGG